MATNYRDIPELADYIKMVENEGKKGYKKVSKWQKKLIKFNKKSHSKTKNLIIKTEQLEKYMSLQKYFDFGLFEMGKISSLTLHCCTFRQDGLPRFPDLMVLVARGAGKNGYLAFEDFCLISPYCEIKQYDIDICATAEEQARTSFDDIYNILENPAQTKKLKRFFYWNKEVITGRKNKSKIKYRTNNAKSKRTDCDLEKD